LLTGGDPREADYDATAWELVPAGGHPTRTPRP
jgi:hypothetical protein